MGDRGHTKGCGHTPGPWSVASLGGQTAVQSESACEIVCRIEEWSSEQDVADARLIAAAPDMFEALLQARDWLEGWVSAEPQLAIIEAALAKATPTGEASDV